MTGKLSSLSSMHLLWSRHQTGFQIDDEQLMHVPSTESLLRLLRHFRECLDWLPTNTVLDAPGTKCGAFHHADPDHAG